MNKFYSDEELGELFGRRIINDGNVIPLFEPMELGWVCPKGSGHYITWSEFKDHVWCYQCEVDYFTLLCPKEMNVYTTENILGEETESMASLMAEWTIEKYKGMKTG